MAVLPERPGRGRALFLGLCWLRPRRGAAAVGWGGSDPDSEVAVDKDRQLRLRHSTDLGRFRLAALEQHQRRDTAHIVLLRGKRIFIDVQFDDRDVVAMSIAELLEGRADSLAGTAPLRPEINQNRSIELLVNQDLLCIRLIDDNNGLLFTHSRTSLTPEHHSYRSNPMVLSRAIAPPLAHPMRMHRDCLPCG